MHDMGSGPMLWCMLGVQMSLLQSCHSMSAFARVPCSSCMSVCMSFCSVKEGRYGAVPGLVADSDIHCSVLVTYKLL